MDFAQPKVVFGLVGALRRGAKWLFLALAPWRCPCGGKMVRIEDDYYNAKDECNRCGKQVEVTETWW